MESMDKLGLILPNGLTIHHIEEAISLLGAALKQRSEIILDASGISQVDACGFQALVAGAKEAQIRGKPFMLVNPSEDLRKVLLITGATKVFSLREEG